MTLSTSMSMSKSTVLKITIKSNTSRHYRSVFKILRTSDFGESGEIVVTLQQNLSSRLDLLCKHCRTVPKHLSQKQFSDLSVHMGRDLEQSSLLANEDINKSEMCGNLLM